MCSTIRQRWRPCSSVSWGSQPAPYRAAQAAGIVGFELIVEQITGAWKLSQRASAPDREGAIAGLRAAGGDDALAIARLMAG